MHAPAQIRRATPGDAGPVTRCVCEAYLKFFRKQPAGESRGGGAA
jgi:hypothetical protein